MSFDFGPDWMWKAIFFFAVVGLLSSVAGLLVSVVLLYNHISITR